MSTNNKVPVDLKKVDYTVKWDNQIIEHLKKEYDLDGDKEIEDEEAFRVMDMIEEYNNKPETMMHLLGRTKGGTRVHLVNKEYDPYFYIPKEQFEPQLRQDDKVIGVETGFTDIKGQETIKVKTRIPSDIRQLRDKYDHYEADIMFPNRFLIDSGIQGSFSVAEEHVGPMPTKVTVNELEDINYTEDSRVCFCDIEVDDSKGFPDEGEAKRKILMLAVYDSYAEDYQVFMYHPDMPHIQHEDARVRVFTSELDMLTSFIDYLHKREFDIITGWNFTDFDARYIVNRIERLSEKDDDSDLNVDDLSKLGQAYDEGYFGAKIKGLVVFDMLRAYKNANFTELDSYRLEDVAQAELGAGKLKDERSFYEQWKQDPQQLVDYNIRDVELLVELEEEQSIIKFFEEIANYVGGRLSECVDASKAVDLKILRAVNGNWTVPSGKQSDGMDFEGGQVFKPISGIKHNVVVLDLASLYPMSMKTINAGPGTKDSDGELVAPNGVRFSNEEDAVVVRIIDEMLEMREEYKELRDNCDSDSKQHEIYDRKQGAIKVVMNTLYGVMGWDKFRLADQDVGSAVTATGRGVIEFTEQVVEEMGYSVTYGDTDSVMIELGEDVTTEEAMEIGHEMEEKINSRYNDYAKEELNADEHFFDIEFEKLYRRYFQAGKKKRYAGHIVWKEGKEVDDVDIVGFEFRRSDYAFIPKHLQEEVLDSIVRGGGLDDIHEHVSEIVGYIRDGEYRLEDVGIPSSVSSDFDSYETKTPAVKGSEWANEHLDAGIQPGDKPKKLFVERVRPNDEGEVEYKDLPSTGDGEKYVCWIDDSDLPDEFEWDWDTYIDKQIKSPLMRILEGTDFSWDEVSSGKRQPGLDEYTFEDSSDGEEDSVAELDSPTQSGGSGGSSKTGEENPLAPNALDNFDAQTVDEDDVQVADFTPIKDGQPELDRYMG